MTAPIPPVRVDHLVAWLWEHRGAFTEEALRGRLLEAGYPPGDVQAAFEILRLQPDGPPGGAHALSTESPGVPPPTPAAWPPSSISEAEVRRQRDAVLAFLVVVGAIVGIPLLLAVNGAASFAVPAAVLALLVALAGWGVLRDSKHPGVASGLGAALLAVVVLPVVAIVALFGYCLVTGGRVY